MEETKQSENGRAHMAGGWTFGEVITGNGVYSSVELTGTESDGSH